jgi:hypothetical protein
MEWDGIFIMLFWLAWTVLVFLIGCYSGAAVADLHSYDRAVAEQDAELRELYDRYGAAR